MSRRRREPEEHVNHERWLVSYADFITLLFAFFVVMYSISSINEGKYKVISEALVGVFTDSDRALRPIQIGDERAKTVTPAQPLVKDDFRRHARIGAAEQDRERLLAGGELVPPGRTGRRAVFARVGDKAPVAFSQPFECQQGSLHSVESDTGWA